jgi:hypothetical protein
MSTSEEGRAPIVPNCRMLKQVRTAFPETFKSQSQKADTNRKRLIVDNVDVTGYSALPSTLIIQISIRRHFFYLIVENHSMDCDCVLNHNREPKRALEERRKYKHLEWCGSCGKTSGVDRATLLTCARVGNLGSLTSSLSWLRSGTVPQCQILL